MSAPSPYHITRATELFKRNPQGFTECELSRRMKISRTWAGRLISSLIGKGTVKRKLAPCCRYRATSRMATRCDMKGIKLPVWVATQPHKKEKA